MAIESDGHSRGNPRLYELIEDLPKTGKSPTIWEWPEIVDWFRVAGQPVPGPWPPDQKPRPDPEAESLPIAVPETEEESGTGAGSQATSQETSQRTGGGTGPRSMGDRS